MDINVIHNKILFILIRQFHLIYLFVCLRSIFNNNWAIFWLLLASDRSDFKMKMLFSSDYLLVSYHSDSIQFKFNNNQYKSMQRYYYSALESLYPVCLPDEGEFILNGFPIFCSAFNGLYGEISRISGDQLYPKFGQIRKSDKSEIFRIFYLFFS